MGETEEKHNHITLEITQLTRLTLMIHKIEPVTKFGSGDIGGIESGGAAFLATADKPDSTADRCDQQQVSQLNHVRIGGRRQRPEHIWA